MKFDSFSPSSRIEANYRLALKAMMDEFVSVLKPLNVTDPLQILAALRDFYNGNFYRQGAYAAASRMVTGLAIDNARTWREAARASMKGRMVYRSLMHELQGPTGYVIQVIIDRNARMITSLAEDMARKVAEFIRDETLKGKRSSAIAEDLVEQFPEASTARLNLIARTETSKASTALTRVRAESLGLDWYVWRTSKDARVRSSHRMLDRVIVNWNDPPAPEALAGIKSTLGHYSAGDAPNCRCYPEPLLRLDQVKFPCKVYRSGSIAYMTRADFARIAGITGGMNKAA
ncbi:MAG: Phage Mu protein F like protein [Syntrophorhabdus sp. PtaU1.Bin002]|nr:MAG: Phage Mu protein F like protein [Syntrophorhabdus sp. PtaU1.Bin002]